MQTVVPNNLISIINPATEEKLAEIPVSTKKEIIEKIHKARSASILWGSLKVDKRIEYLKKIYDIIIKDRKNIAETVTKNNGKPLSESYLTEVASALQVLEYFIKNGNELLSEKPIQLGPLYPTKKSFLSYEPLGVIGIIEPWNYPFYIPISAIIKTLLAGNTLIFKPSSTTALVGKLIEEILNKVGLPDGVANVIYGGGNEANILLKGGIDKVIFTGSVEIGKSIAETASRELLPVSLELGGKDPAIVFKSCNLDYATGGILWGAIANCGQACASIERVYVEGAIHDAFIDKIVNLAKNLKMGNGLDEDIDVGPLATFEQVNTIEEHVKDAISKGAKLHIGGKKIEGKGFFYEPTILSNVNHSMKIMTEETFGPVIPIMQFNTKEEAIRLANDSKYGLAASIWTGDLANVKKIAESLYCGTVWVNDSLFQQAHPACPWQGYRESGYGGSSIYDFLRTKHISVDHGFIPVVHPKSFWWFPYKGKSTSYYNLVELMFKSGIKDKTNALFQAFINLSK